MLGGGGRSRRLACWTALLFLGCATPTALPPAAAMLGAWSYNSALVVDGPSLNAGLHVTLTVDSVAGMAFFGRVTRWFAGDVGIWPEALGPLTGRLDEAGGVTIVVSRASASTLTITGDLTGDIVTIRESWVGAEPGPFPSGGSFRRSLE